MIEIYLNPAQELIFSSQADQMSYSPTPENIAASKELVNELKVKGVDTSIIDCQILIATL